MIYSNIVFHLFFPLIFLFNIDNSFLFLFFFFPVTRRSVLCVSGLISRFSIAYHRFVFFSLKFRFFSVKLSFAARISTRVHFPGFFLRRCPSSWWYGRGLPRLLHDDGGHLHLLRLNCGRHCLLRQRGLWTIPRGWSVRLRRRKSWNCYCYCSRHRCCRSLIGRSWSS